MMNPNDILRQIFKNRSIENVKTLVKWLFPTVNAAQNITHYQAYLVKRIAFSEVKRLSISAFTRYGKSQVVAIAVAIYILINENKRVKFIGPTDDQAQIIKNYMSELILSSRGNILFNLSELELKEKKERLKAEASQKRMTFRNGCEYRVVTAHGKGFSAMGHGADLIIMDEASLISRESYAKITRMLGDDPENASLIELYNPWDRDTKAYDHSISPLFERIQIDYKIGLQEGRITEEFVEEMRKDITPLEFCVLYESKFPEEAEDSLISLIHIERAEKTEFNHLDRINEILEKLSKKTTLSESDYNYYSEELKRYEFLVSCDPADKGLDFTVMYWGITKDRQEFEVLGVWSEAKSESMSVVGKIINKSKTFIPESCKGVINIDKIGIGVGAESRLREIKNEQGLEKIKVVGCNFGEKANNEKEFMNKKAENFFRLRSLFIDNNISLKAIIKDKNYPKVKSELLIMKWELTSGEKKRIIDPDKSPDFADGMVFFVWKDKKQLVADFL